MTLPRQHAGVERRRARERGGDARERTTGGGWTRWGHHEEALAHPHPGVHAAERREAGVDGDDLLGGRRSSTFVSFVAVARGRANQCSRDALCEAANALHTYG